MNEPIQTPERRERFSVSGRLIAGLVAAAAVALLSYFALGMPGMNHGATDMPVGMPMPANAEPSWSLDPPSFERFIANDNVAVVNVHIPYDGEIPDTDAFVPFDTIAASAAIPTDHSAPIALYCRSGRMSKIALDTLRAKGYTNVVHLSGGMRAWASSGRTVLANETRRVGASNPEPTTLAP